MNNDNEIKSAAIINAATEQFRSLLFTVEWDALAMAPKVSVKVGWSVRFKDESETEIDPLQSKLGLEEIK